jgi:stage V sporulation protein D (sporulation-specific penicillin-binding protein)
VQVSILRQKGIVKKRTAWLFIIFALFYVVIAGRLFWVQVYDNSRYKKWAGFIRSRKLVIPASRGDILDRNGRPLAFSVESASVFANRNEAKDKLPEIADEVSSIIGVSREDLMRKLQGRGTIIWLGKKLDPSVGEKIEECGSDLPGVGVEDGTKRVYPSGGLAAQILGFTNSTGKGAEGLEHTLNNILAGENGLCKAELDARRRIISETRRQIKDPKNGKDVYLTIDMNIQNIAEVALNKMAKQYKPQSACAIVMDPHTGEILALANYPGFDPNHPAKSNSSFWRNRAVADLYEPGSTLKAVTVSAALEEGISQYQVVAHCSGVERIGKRTIRCSLHYPFGNGHGAVDMYRLIQQSCNIASAHLAFRMGAKKVYKYEKAFGLFDRIDAGFGCEAAGSLLPPDEWSQIQLGNIGFGQGIAVNALQMTNVYSTIANDGIRLEPRIIREIRNPDGSIYKRYKTVSAGRVISEHTVLTMKKLLVSCVLDGTGKPAKIPGRTVAGKTGSAQIAGKGGYESGSFIASFMGFAPAFKPRLVIAVVVNRPKDSHWGATVAAPVFKEIGEKTLWYLKVPAEAPVDDKENNKQDSNGKPLA